MGRFRFRIVCLVFLWLPAAVMVDERPAVTVAQMGLRAMDMSGSALAPVTSLRPALREGWAMPDLRWDDHPRGSPWTTAVMAALRAHGAPLMDVVPRDIAAWCPGYPQADEGQRAAFWAGLILVLAWHESAHDPHAVGGGG